MKLKYLASLALVGSSFSAMAADPSPSATLPLTGYVIPGACNPKFPVGSLDLGTIKVAELNPTDFTSLPKKSIQLVIQCDAPTKVAVTFSDDRKGSVITGKGLGAFISNSMGTALLTESLLFGLGQSGAINIGGYMVRFNDSTSASGDGKNIQALFQDSGNTGKWTASNGQIAFPTAGSRYFSWGTAGTSTPNAYSSITQSIDVYAALNKTADLKPALTNAVNLDGSITVTLKYL